MILCGSGAPMKISGRFITVEGGEGTGKSLQVELLKKEFERLDILSLFTREPGGTPFGKELRAILLNKEGPNREPLPELLLYLADRYQHLKEVIEPALRENKVVVCDRYHDATVVYQGYARGLGFQLVDALARPLGIREPDLTFVLDLDVELALDRARFRNDTDGISELGRFEAENLDFHRKIREGYRLLADRHPERLVLIPAKGSPEEVFRRIVRVLERKYQLGIDRADQRLHRQ